MYNLCDYLTYQGVFFGFFSNNVGSYDPRSHLPPTILPRIPILTTLPGGLHQWPLTLSGPCSLLSKKDKLQSANLAFPKTTPIDDTQKISKQNASGFNGLEVAWNVFYLKQNVFVSPAAEPNSLSKIQPRYTAKNRTHIFLLCGT